MVALTASTALRRPMSTHCEASAPAPWSNDRSGGTVVRALR
jgi:hypothetical protein